jgi:hypothetical protein
MGYEYLGFSALVFGMLIGRMLSRRAIFQLDVEKRRLMKDIFGAYRYFILLVLFSIFTIFYDQPIFLLMALVLGLFSYHTAYYVRLKGLEFPESFLRSYLASKVFYYLGFGVCWASVSMGQGSL